MTIAIILRPRLSSATSTMPGASYSDRPRPADGRRSHHHNRRRAGTFFVVLRRRAPDIRASATSCYLEAPPSLIYEPTSPQWIVRAPLSPNRSATRALLARMPRIDSHGDLRTVLGFGAPDQIAKLAPIAAAERAIEQNARWASIEVHTDAVAPTKTTCRSRRRRSRAVALTEYSRCHREPDHPGYG